MTWQELEAAIERVAKAFFARDHRGSAWERAVRQTQQAYLDEASNIVIGRTKMTRPREMPPLVGWRGND